MQVSSIEKVRSYEVRRVSSGVSSRERVAVPIEQTVLLIVNGERLFAFQCTPDMIEELVTGFLVTAGLIRARDQIINIAYDPDRRQASAKLELPRGCLSDFRNEKGFVSPPRAAGSAQTNTGFRVTADTLLSAMREFRDRAERPGRPKSVHAAAIAGVAGILAHAEDVGRNNATDKVVGACVLQDIPTHDKMLLTTGRISLEVATKCLRAGIPIISSFKAPTTGAVDLARNAAIALAGRVTAGGMVLFSADWRIE